MANYVGAVRFPDGKLMWFSYQGTTDTARRALYDCPDDVEHDLSLIQVQRIANDDEEVEVMPYFEHGSDKVAFTSMASRSLALITGTINLDECHSRSSGDGFW